MTTLDDALRAFDAAAYAACHGGYKESRSQRSCEYLLTCRCGSDRLRWRHEPDGKRAWICWGCRRSGDTLALLEWLDGLTRVQAIEAVHQGYEGGDAPTSIEHSIATKTQVSLWRLPTIPWPAHTVLAERDSRAMAYLSGQRGIPAAVIHAARVGYGTAGRLKHYAVFPALMDGGLVYWQARACWDPPPHLDQGQRKAWAKATGYRKTLNPPAVAGTVGASEVLFNHDLASTYRHVVVTEGPVDALKVGPHAVALLGKHFSDAKVARLRRMPAQRITIYLDRGAEERAKALELAERLAGVAEIAIATPPVGHDPGSLTAQQNAAVIAAAEPYRPRGLRSVL